MANKQTGKAIVVLVALFAVFSVAMFGLNFVTGPMIEANNASQAYGPLFAVMPEADDFEPVYMADGRVASTLVEVPETVKAIYKETSGYGGGCTQWEDQGVLHTFHRMEAHTVNGVMGNSYAATKEKGEILADVNTKKLVEILSDDAIWQMKV